MSFAVHKLAKFSSNPGKVYFEGLVYLLRYIRDTKTLDLKYYDEMKDAPLSELSRKDIIKTKNQLMVFSDSIRKDFPKTGRSKGAYMMFYQGGPIDHVTHILVTVAQ